MITLLFDKLFIELSDFVYDIKPFQTKVKTVNVEPYL